MMITYDMAQYVHKTARRYLHRPEEGVSITIVSHWTGVATTVFNTHLPMEKMKGLGYPRCVHEQCQTDCHGTAKHGAEALTDRRKKQRTCLIDGVAAYPHACLLGCLLTCLLTYLRRRRAKHPKT